MIPFVAAAAATVAVALSGAHAPNHADVHTGHLPKGEAAIFTDLRHEGLTRVQASGIMANMDHESMFNVENHAMDSNGFRGYGLFSWNSQWYPTASKLVTGNPAADLKAQIKFMIHQTSHYDQGIEGKTAYQVGGNWSRWVEVCVNCEPGRKQWLQRSAEASAIHREAA